MLDLEARFIMWWRVNISGRLHLGAFFRFVLEQDDRSTHTQGETS